MAKRQALDIGQHALPRATTDISTLPLSALLCESDFNMDELVSNHRAREISVKYLSQRRNSVNAQYGRETSNLSITNLALSNHTCRAVTCIKPFHKKKIKAIAQNANNTVFMLIAFPFLQ